MNRLTETVVTIGVAIVGVAILAVLVSQKSNTAGVLRAAGSAFSEALGTAVGPVTGFTPQVSGGQFPIGNFGFSGTQGF